MRFPRWLGVIGCVVGFPLFHAGLPWMLSRFGVRHGWVDGGPGLWNWTGVIPVVLGFAAAAWCVWRHFDMAPEGWPVERTAHYPTPTYLLESGPYRYSRNPIYVAEFVIWVGWIVFYGSLWVLLVLTGMAVTLGPVVVRLEEKGLEARFGESYRAYQRRVPRWIRLRRA